MITFIYTDGRRETYPLAELIKASDVELSCNIINDIYTLTLTPNTDKVRLTAIEAEISLSETIAQPEDNLFMYDNSSHTNDITGIFPYVGNEKREAAELLLLKNLTSGETALCGYLTAQRFWASMYLGTGDNGITVTFRFELEDRELNKGEAYIMERFSVVLGGHNNENALLETYADNVARLNNARPTAPLPTGWCSWSCYYGGVDQEKIRRAADSQIAYAKKGHPNLIQIDDGWQRCGSFCGEWVADDNKFPDGLEETAKYVIDKGMTFGLWLAPCMLDDQSEYYEGLKDISMEIATMGEHYHPFDLGAPAYHEHLRKTFRKMTDEYHARYFKLDFLAASIQNFEDNGKPVKFKDGFCVELLRRALTTIRETVGEEVFLLSCGAQTLIGAGILDGARMSCDIIWGKNKNNPSYWQIMKDCMKTVSWRYFYHRRVYVNDPDGVVLRDIDVGDGFNCTYSESEMWAIAVAMSGGAVLSNDELEKLSPGRRSLYTRLLPPLGIPGHPIDYFQRPEPDAYVIDVDENTKFLALYNLGDKMTDISYDLGNIGMAGALVVRCIKTKALGFMDTIKIENANPHSGAMFLLRRPTSEPTFAFSDANIYGGINLVDAKYENGNVTVLRPEGYEDAKVYMLYPEGCTPVGEIVIEGEKATLTRCES